MSVAPALTPWRLSGSYFEACNCEAICPCRSQGGRVGGRSTFGVCDFALSWRILEGRAASLDLSGLAVVLAGSFEDDEPDSPWRVALYLDESADEEQRYAVTEIFLGRTGGTTLRNFARLIGEVYAVRPARIEVDHSPNGQRIRADDYVTVRGVEPVPSDQSITCGIPGHDRPGQELRTGVPAGCRSAPRLGGTRPLRLCDRLRLQLRRSLVIGPPLEAIARGLRVPETEPVTLGRQRELGLD